MAELAHHDGARLSADIGGTFTDIVLERGASRWSRKLLTTHAAPEQALLRGLTDILRQAGVYPVEVTWFVHGTTLATNALIERRGARTALLTTRGFRDVLEIGYEGRYDPMDLRLEKRRPLVPRELRFTVAERLSARGDVLIPLDERDLHPVIESLRANEIESLAIGFLHAYADPRHERLARDVILSRCQNLSISLSSDVCPEIREYERISTAVANAYVQPLVATYLDRLAAELAGIGLTCPLMLMTSGGGLMPLELAKRVPVRLVESGPAGGAVLSAGLAAEIGESRVLSFDMGGTTAKICFIADGMPQTARVFEVDRAARFRKGSGLPLRMPVVELIEIGAGGGSIAGVDAMGRIVVGPHSAGSEPGPACYGRGGDGPTVTDGDLLLGKISIERFAGGTIRLNEDLARQAVAAHVGKKVQLDAVSAAFGAVEVVDEMMANAARVHGAELGKDVAAHTMIAFGGAAPLHAARLAEKIGVSRIIIPRNAGVGSAVGFLMAPLAYDIVISRPLRLDAFDAATVRGVLEDLAIRIRAARRDLGDLEEADVAITRQVDMRYAGQGHEVVVPLDGEEPTAAWLRDAFEGRYAALFGRIIPGAPIEAVSWQARLSRETWHPVATNPAQRAAAPRPRGRRGVFDAGAGAFVDYAVYERSDFRPGARVPGPALVVEDETTTLATGAFTVSMDARSHLILERSADERRPP
jgi:N-methylhydantoinase A